MTANFAGFAIVGDIPINQGTITTTGGPVTWVFMSDFRQAPPAGAAGTNEEVLVNDN